MRPQLNSGTLGRCGEIEIQRLDDVAWSANSARSRASASGQRRAAFTCCYAWLRKALRAANADCRAQTSPGPQALSDARATAAAARRDQRPVPTERLTLSPSRGERPRSETNNLFN